MDIVEIICVKKVTQFFTYE